MRNYTGKRFGHLTAARPNYKDRDGTWRWIFQCTCGNEVDAAPRYLAKRVEDGHEPHCGCQRSGSSKSNRSAAARHPLYKYWERMISACSNPKHPLYPECKAYGVKVYAPWRRDPGVFFNDVEPLFDPSIRYPRFIRVLRSQDYEPGNVAFVTASEANDNQNRCYKIITPMGPMTVRQAAEHYGVDKFDLRRAAELEEDLAPFFGGQEPLQQPSRNTERVLVPTPEGEFITLTEASERSGIGRVTIYERMKRNWPIERLFEPVAKR